LTLTKANTYAGGTTINAGTLNVTGSIAGNVTVNGGVLKLGSTTALASGATLTLPGSPSASQVNLNFSGTQNIAALYFGTTQMAAGTWGASGAQHNNAAFTGSGLLNVASGPQPTIAITSITPNPVCSGSTVSLTATVSGGNPNSAPSGTVQFFKGVTSLGTQPLLSGTATLTGISLPAGTYANITAQYSGDNYNNTATSAAASPSLVVNALPTVTTTPSGSTTLCSGSSVGITASGASTYTWSPGTGLSATTGASVTANPTTTTAYTVTGTDANGCQNTATLTVTVQNCSPPNITNIVVNLDGSFSMICTGVLSTPYVLKATGDVTTPKPWTTRQSGTISVSPFTLTDGPSGLPQQRFYYLTNNPN
jgi:autotransporter-associated beta strand protein